MVKDFNGEAVVRATSNRWEGNADYTGPTKTPASQSIAQKKGDENSALREHGNNYENANNANLSGRPTVVEAFNGPTVVREVSNRW